MAGAGFKLDPVGGEREFKTELHKRGIILLYKTKETNTMER